MEETTNYYNKESIELGRKIKVLRTINGMTQAQLCEAAAPFTGKGKPIRQATLASIENGRYNTSIRMLMILLDAMGYEIAFIKKDRPID